jgi:hypothetical protein
MSFLTPVHESSLCVRRFDEQSNLSHGAISDACIGARGAIIAMVQEFF